MINRLANGKTSITPDTNSAVVAFDGAWEEGEFAILLSGTGDASLWVHGTGDVSPTKSLGLLFEKSVRQGTINVPASHPALLAVGCTINRISWDPLSGPPLQLSSLGGESNPQPDSVCYFSAAGPTPFGAPKPEISAPGAFVVGAMSTDADPRINPGGMFDAPGCPPGTPCYVVDDYHAITSGTSMSSPHVAGAVALLFQQDPTLTQARVTDVIQAGARYPQGVVHHETQLGPGELDLEGALQSLKEDQGADPEPDPTKSWYILSSVYAKPDPSWPVWGTVELRHEDGTVAGGIQGTKLALHVENGLVVQPLTKVRRGLFRFAVAGQSGSGGSSMIVDVTYGGMSLGKSGKPRELPIGADIWLATGEFEADGGCSCRAVGNGDAKQRPWPVVLAVLGLLALGGRRARISRS